MGYEEKTHDLKHKIHRDEHVDTSVNKYDDGDTEVCNEAIELNQWHFQVTEIKKRFTQRVVQETTETLGTKSMSGTYSESTPKVLLFFTTVKKLTYFRPKDGTEAARNFRRQLNVDFPGVWTRPPVILSKIFHQPSLPIYLQIYQHCTHFGLYFGLIFT